MSDLRKAAQMALAAWDASLRWPFPANPHTAFEALRAALAQPEQEPVAWVFVPNNELLWPREVEATNPIEIDSYYPLYTAPHQRKPLTEKEIDELIYSMAGADRANDRFRTSFARAIEKAHGIGETT